MVAGVTFGQCMNCGSQGPPCSTSDSADVGPLKRWNQWSDDDLRESVRRLVGEWEKKKATADTAAERYAERNNEPLAQIFDKASDTYRECIRDLTAFLAENKEIEL